VPCETPCLHIRCRLVPDTAIFNVYIAFLIVRCLATNRKKISACYNTNTTRSHDGASWEMNQTLEIDGNDLQNDKMKLDRIILDVDCSTPHCFKLPQRPCITHVQHMSFIKGSDIRGSWGIRLMTLSLQVEIAES